MIDCCSPCSTQIAPVNIPGAPGTDGTDGAQGAPGQNAYTSTTVDFTSPADTTTAFNISIASSLSFIVGMDVMAGQGPGVALANPGPWAGVITAIPSPNAITVKNLRTVDENVTVSSGALVAAIGLLAAVPITVAQGGTNATTKAGAQTNLGVGQDSQISSGAALAQALTNGFVQVGAIDVQLPAAGVWELRGQVGIDFNGVTFAANRTITAKLRNVTQNIDLASGVMHTQSPTTTSYPTHFLQLPPLKYTGAAANDHIQLMIMIDTVASAGTNTVDSGSLEAIPLRLT